MATTLTLTLGGPWTPARPAAAEVVEALTIVPTQAGTAGKSRCGPLQLSTPGTDCLGFAGQDVRTLQDLWVVGYENNREVGQKHVLQTVAAFDLAQLRNLPAKTTLTRAALGYAEASTVRRSPSGNAEYGVLSTCNTRLGVPVDGWNESLDGVVPTRSAVTAGVAGATTGDVGSWDVTPQVKGWLEGGAARGTFVMQGEDESLDVKEMAMCLSYVFNLGLTAELTTAD